MSKSIEDIVLDNKIYFHLLIENNVRTVLMSFLDADEFWDLLASIQDREMNYGEILSELEDQWCFQFIFESVNHID